MIDASKASLLEIQVLRFALDNEMIRLRNIAMSGHCEETCKAARTWLVVANRIRTKVRAR